MFKLFFVHLLLAVLVGGRVPAAGRPNCARWPPSAPSAAPSTASTWTRWSAASSGPLRTRARPATAASGRTLSAAIRPRCTATRCSSAPGYKDSNPKDVNMGACLEIAADMRVSAKRLQVSVTFRRLRAKRSRRHTPRFVEKKTVNL
ncbi:hypothetical protein M3Y99_01991200 [Aphelenchoides fujianensis]|nr:hypothetical protein M3Y99_01991200 [Aphelenchoides fujianensis]